MNMGVLTCLVLKCNRTQLSPHNLSNNLANFKVMEPDFMTTSIFKSAVFALKVLYLDIAPTQETFGHKVIVSVEKKKHNFQVL